MAEQLEHSASVPQLHSYGTYIMCKYIYIYIYVQDRPKVIFFRSQAVFSRHQGVKCKYLGSMALFIAIYYIYLMYGL